jgi:hypothetical protein
MSLAPPGTVAKAPVAEDLEFLSIEANDLSSPRFVLSPFLALKPLLCLDSHHSLL